MQYGEFIAQNRSIQHDKSCPVIRIGILGMLAHALLSFCKRKLKIQRYIFCNLSVYICDANYICCNGCFAGIVFNVLDHISFAIWLD